MTNRTSPVRRYSRFPVSWPVLYGNDAFLAEGTVLDLTSLGWRVAGAMPVAPGMQLSLKVSVPDRSRPLCIQRATVLWVKDHEFAIEAHEMEPSDEDWVTEFLRNKLGLMWMSPAIEQETTPHAKEKLPCGESTLPQPCVPSLDDILHRFSAIDLASIDMSAEARRNRDSNFQKADGHIPGEDMPEKTLREARRIVRCMVAIKTVRVRTGQNPVPDN